VNPLLARQLRKHLPHLDPADPQWRTFLAAVDAAYTELEQDHAFLGHTLEVTSAELTEANERLRREAENRLASLSRYYQQTLELQQGMILCVQRTPCGFEHTLCRGELMRRLGLTPEDIEGRVVDEIAPPPQAAELNAAYTRAWSGESFSFTFTTSEGVELFILIRPRFENGEVHEIIASCVEITALKEAERELRAAKERAEAADRAKSEFLAVMSHEIRTPLNAVLGFAALLQQSSLNDEQQSWLKTIGSSGESLLALINDILDFSKIEAGQLTLHHEPVALAVLLDELTSMFRSRAEAKGVTLDVVPAPDLPEIILVDAQRLRQVLVNLVGNAVKFTPRGAIRILVYTGAPSATAPSERQIWFSIRDTGIGIPLDRRDRLFKPFSQVDSSTTRTYGGTGLGLAICDRLVRMLGGDISVESTPGEGSTFTFSVRATVTSLSDAFVHPMPATVSTAVPAPVVPQTLRILLAEDQPQNRQLIRQVLQSRGYRADIVENGRQAVEAATTRDYDLLLLDLRMPEMDGLEAAWTIRERLHDRTQPKIYALTANVFPEDRERCLKAGMDGILTKPLNFKELFDTVAAVESQLKQPSQ
jgi:PAS domain S-box-containing protein